MSGPPTDGEQTRPVGLSAVVSHAAFAALTLYVFSIPFERSIAIGVIGALGKVIGFAAVGLGILSLFRRGGIQLRRPSLFLVIMALFVSMAVVSYFWSIAPNASLTRAFTFVQQWLVVALVWQLARTTEQQRSLFQAYVLGGYVAVSAMIYGLVTGWGVDKGARFSGFDSNANWAALAIALAVPVAWRLATSAAGTASRIVNGLYPVFALFAVGLAASRGGLIVAVIGLALLPFSLPRLGWWRSVLLTIVLGGAAYVGWSYLPTANVMRLASAGEELTQGDLTGRTEIWEAGLEAFPRRPAIGAGSGTYSDAVGSILGQSTASHNGYLAILVELGIVGFVLFISLFCLAIIPVVRTTRGVERAFYVILGIAIVVTLMPANFEFHKATWVILALFTARAAVVIRTDASYVRADVARGGGPVVSEDVASTV